jgi:hypothetical protein
MLIIGGLLLGWGGLSLPRHPNLCQKGQFFKNYLIRGNVNRTFFLKKKSPNYQNIKAGVLSSSKSQNRNFRVLIINTSHIHVKKSNNDSIRNYH